MTSDICECGHARKDHMYNGEGSCTQAALVRPTVIESIWDAVCPCGEFEQPDESQPGEGREACS